MAIPRYVCRGFSIGKWSVPPFELNGNDAITLVVPQEMTPLSDALIAVLCRNASGVVESSGKVIWAEPARMPSRLRRLIKGSSASGWLQRRAGISTQRAREVVERLQIKNDNLGVLAANPRLFLGLAAAWELGADVLIFSTCGNDPLGVEAAFGMVQDHLANCSSIYVSFPFTTAGTRSHRVFPGSTVVEIAHPAVVSV